MYPEHEIIVTITGQEISCRRPDGLVESVAWDDLRAVLLQTTSEGPFSVDVYWILVGNRSGCVIPQGANGEQALLARLQTLEGFDNDMVIQAMLSVEDQRFLCWEKKPT